MLRQVDVSGCLCVRVVDVHAAAGVLIGNCAADRPFVDVQIDLRGCDGAVTEQLLNKFDVGAFLQQEGGEGVPLRYNKDKRKNPVFSRVSAFVVAYSIPFPTLIANEKSVE